MINLNHYADLLEFETEQCVDCTEEVLSQLNYLINRMRYTALKYNL